MDERRSRAPVDLERPPTAAHLPTDPAALEQTLTFDPGTGALLADERVRIGPDGRLMLRSALALLLTGRVSSLDERPSSGGTDQP